MVAVELHGTVSQLSLSSSGTLCYAGGGEHCLEYIMPDRPEEGDKGSGGGRDKCLVVGSSDRHCARSENK